MLIPIPEEENEETDEPQSNTTQNTNDLHCTTNDTWWDKQWPLYNGYCVYSYTDYQGEYDVNACEAWQYTEGENSNVAIIGYNVNMDNTSYDYHSNLAVTSYNAATQSSPNYTISTLCKERIKHLQLLLLKITISVLLV